MKKSASKTSAPKSTLKKETWFKELQGPVLKTLVPVCLKYEKGVGPLPECYERPWIEEIYRLLEASINKVFNLKDDLSCDATTLGILAAQGSNCEEMNFAPLLKAKNVKPRMRRRMAKLISLVSPMQEALGRMSRKIRRVMDRQPWETRVAFEDGYARALHKKMYCGANPVFWEDTPTRLYLLLLFLAPWMHQVKSVKHLHELLHPRARVIVGDDPKRLEKVCQRIGLRFRVRLTDKAVVT